jgi:hypothetical protein
MVVTVDHELDRITYGGEPKQPSGVAKKYPKPPSRHNASPECFDANKRVAEKAGNNSRPVKVCDRRLLGDDWLARMNESGRRVLPESTRYHGPDISASDAPPQVEFNALGT